MYIFYLHIHVKIQCRFPLDRRVRMDSQVQFVRRTEMHPGLGFPPGHYPNTLVYMKWFRKHFCTVLFSPSAQQRSFLTCSFIQIIGLKYYVRLWWRSPNVSGWILWFFLKRACLCPRAAARHGWAVGRAAHTTRPRVLMLTAHRLKKDGCRILRNQSHI